jgi:hypothetical protein
MNDKRFIEKMSKLSTWTGNPSTVEDLKDILNQFSEVELAIAAQVYSPGSSAGRLAWTEFARRKGYLDFEFKMSYLKDKALLDVTAGAKPVHDQPILTADNKKND